MSMYRWKNRPLLVFAPAADHPELQRQRTLLEGSAAGLRERDMVVIFVVGNSVEVLSGPSPGLNAAELRRRYTVPRSEFRSILVGKDAGSKIVSRAPLTTGRLFSTIDSMPMRRDEMRRGG